MENSSSLPFDTQKIPPALLDSKMIKGYNAIKEFVTALNDVFGTKSIPLNVYFRILKKGEDKKHNNLLSKYIRRHTKAFVKFLSDNTITETLIGLTGSTLIRYNNRAYIDMSFIIKNSDAETSSQIRKHLLAIKALLLGDKQSIETYEKTKKPAIVIPDLASKVDTSTKEGEIIHDLIKNVQTTMSAKNIASNPMDVMKNLMSSGAVEKFMGNLANNELDPTKMLSSAAGLFGTIMGPETQGMMQNFFKMASQMEPPKDDELLIKKEKEILQKEKELAEKERVLAQKKDKLDALNDSLDESVQSNPPETSEDTPQDTIIEID